MFESDSANNTNPLGGAGSVTDDDEDIHVCKKCQITFTNLQDYLEHKIHHDNYRVTFGRSKKDRWMIVPKLQAIEKKTSEKENETAPKFKRRGRRKVELIDKSLITEKTTYSCSKCPKTFNREAPLRRHMETDHNSDQEDDSDEDRLEVDEEYVGDSSDVDFVARRAPTSEGKAVKTTTPEQDEAERPYMCPVCGHRFKDMGVLKTHMLTHSNEREYACWFENCSFAFKTKGSLKRHIRRHTGERPFKCDLCGRSFTESGALNRHLKSRVPCTAKTDSELPRYGKSWSTDLDKALINPEKAKDNPLLDHQAVLLKNMESGEVGSAAEVINALINQTDFDGNDGHPELSEMSNSEVTVGTENPDDSVLDEVPLDELSPTQCWICHEEYPTTDYLCLHLRTHLADVPHRCDLCHFVTDEGDLDQHLLAIHAPQLKEGVNDVAVKMVMNKMKAEAQKKHNAGSLTRDAAIAVRQLMGISQPDKEPASQVVPVVYRCPVCPRSFRGSNYLKIHMKGHIGERLFKCHICNKDFITKDTLSKHSHIHCSDRHYKCGVCFKLFKRMSHVREHLKIHSGERPFVCTVCEKSFKTNNAMKVHMRIHSALLPYKCSYCHHLFREKGSLLRHVRMHTGDRPYKCRHCLRTFAEQGTLGRHLKAKVPCTKGLEQHRLRHHKQSLFMKNDSGGSSEAFPTVLAEFSVVADTQQYMVSEDGGHLITADNVQELIDQGTGEPAEYVVVQTDSDFMEPAQNVEVISEEALESAILSSMNNADETPAYMIVRKDDNGLIHLVDPDSGQTLQVIMDNDLEPGQDLEVTMATGENEQDVITMVAEDNVTDTCTLAMEQHENEIQTVAMVPLDNDIEGFGMTTHETEADVVAVTMQESEPVVMVLHDPEEVTMETDQTADAIQQAMMEANVGEDQNVVIAVEPPST